MTACPFVQSSAMKSIEVVAISRSFEEAFQKCLRMVDENFTGFEPYERTITDDNEELPSSIVANADQSNTEESLLHIFRQENNEELAQKDLKPTYNEKKKKNWFFGIRKLYLFRLILI
ncbi:unnamed protein product [Rotaria sp. Silwood1]|nr:unnamed protein product [Rotaria sp. Silwood1]